MATNIYQTGDVVVLAGSFTDSLGNYVDPTAVTCKVMKPDGSTLIYSAPVNDAVGKYHQDVQADLSGTWYYRWEGTGVGTAATSDIAFYVEPTRF